jgi:hypothetical protein
VKLSIDAGFRSHVSSSCFHARRFATTAADQELERIITAAQKHPASQKLQTRKASSSAAKQAALPKRGQQSRSSRLDRPGAAVSQSPIRA